MGHCVTHGRSARQNRSCRTRFRGSLSNQKDDSKAREQGEVSGHFSIKPQPRPYRRGGGTTEQPELAQRQSTAPGCSLASRLAAQLRTITSEFAATAHGWADAPTSAQLYRTYPPACQDHRDVVDMAHRTTQSDYCKIYSFFLKLKSRLSAITQHVYAGPDANARRHGWQIIVTHGGVGRRYRDARFDYLVPCVACNGCGSNTCGTICPACGGTGRISLDPATVYRSGRGQP